MAEGDKKRVGKFEIGKTLGEGTFGKVKLAVNPETGEKVRCSALGSANARSLAAAFSDVASAARALNSAR